MSTQERLDPIDEEFLALMQPPEVISPDECEDGFVYQVLPGNYGEVAICHTNGGIITFEGVRDKNNVYLERSAHHEQSQWGSFMPVRQLYEFAPFAVTQQKEQIKWLIQEELAIVTQRLERLAAMPDYLKASPYYQDQVEKDQTAKDRLNSVLGWRFNPEINALEPPRPLSAYTR